MDSTIKEINEAVVSHVVSTTKGVVEFNQKMWADYIALSNKVVAMIPGFSSFTIPTKK